MKNTLPNFLIVGAAKSGTSSLHNYLSQHHQVFMPSYNIHGMKVKEPRFLIKDLVQHRLHNGIWSWEEYQSLFDQVRDEKAIGESTVLYLYYYDLAIRNIKEKLGDDIKIIIMLRNPIDRAYSAFQHVSRGLKEENSFEKALEIESGRMERDLHLTPMVMYKDMGMYFNMVKAYLESFKEVHIIFYENFRDDTNLEIQRAFDFLQIENNTNIDFSKKYNVGGKRWRNKQIKSLFMKDTKFKEMTKKLLPQEIRKVIRKRLINASTEKVEPMSVETRKKLKIFFRKDIENLSILLNHDLTYWIK